MGSAIYKKMYPHHFHARYRYDEKCLPCKQGIKILEKSPGKRIDSLSFFCYDTSINRIFALIGKSTRIGLRQRALVIGWERERQAGGEGASGSDGETP